MAHQISIRSIVLCVVLCFASNVAAVSAVLGVDFGTEYIKAALVKPGGFDIVLTKDSRRKETSAVAFKPPRGALAQDEYPERLYGSDAIALAARFPGDVYPNIKTLFGLSTDHAIAQEYLTRHPALQVEKTGAHDSAAFKSKAFSEAEEVWMVEELLAMELQSIQQNAEAVAGSSIQSVVITVPPYYTTEEKRALEQAANLTGLKVMSLISDGVAVGLNYATTRTFPNINEGGQAEQHLVFDMGAGSASATIMKFQGRNVKDVGKFNKTIQEIQTVGTAWDRSLGGDALNYLIVDDMISKFLETSAAKKASVTDEGIRSHGRAMAKLLKEAERLRHVLSANVDSQGSFEGLYEDIDFKYKITRTDFEAMAEDHSSRVAAVLQAALAQADLDISQVDSIILHGGATRTPFVQKQLEKIAGSDKLRANVNSDEAAVFGAGFRAASISPAFRVKEFRVSDNSGYPVGMQWTNPQGKPQQQRLFTSRSLIGSTPKEVTFANHEDFSVKFYQQLPHADGSIEKETASMSTTNLTASVASLVEKNGCSDADIQLKVQIRLAAESGEVDILKALVECEAEEAEKDGIIDGVKNLFGFGKKDSDDVEGDASESSTTVEATTTSAGDTKATGSSGAGAEDTPNKKILIQIPVSYTVDKLGEPRLSTAGELKAKQRIKAFQASDKARQLREETLNQLEAFTYKIRDLLESESFVAASSEEERSTLEGKASDASDWLYDDGEDAPRAELKARLDELRKMVTPIQKRVDEGERRPELIETLVTAIDSASTFIEQIKTLMVEAEERSSSYSSRYSSTSTADGSSTVTAAPEADSDFDGLEDEETVSTATTAAPEVLPPPIYTTDDLQTIEDLTRETREWLEKKISEQEKLDATADPAIRAEDIEGKTRKLEKAGQELALKGKKPLESKTKGKKKDSGSKKSSKTKKQGATETESAGSGPTIDPKDAENFIKLGEDGKMPTEEELEEMIRKLTQKQNEKDEAKHDEL